MVESAAPSPSKSMGRLKVIWSREEDMQHDVYRPVYRDTLSATVANGRISGWKHRIAGSSILARWLPPASFKGIDIDAVDSVRRYSYDIPNLRVEYVRGCLRYPRGFGAASAPITMYLPSKASSTSWRKNPTRIRWRFAATCSASRPACWPRSILPQPSPIALARTHWTWHRAARRVRQLHRDRCRSRSRRARRGACTPYGLRRGYRHRRQSGHCGCATAGRLDSRPAPPRCMAISPSTGVESSKATSMTTACCASTKLPRSRCT